MVDGKECGAYTDVRKNAFLVDGCDGDGGVYVCVFNSLFLFEKT